MKSKKGSGFIQLKDRILLQAKLARYFALSALNAWSNFTYKLLQMPVLYFDTNRTRYSTAI